MGGEIAALRAFLMRKNKLRGMKKDGS